MKYTYISILLLFAGILNAQEEMTLQKALALGLENNFQIKIADQFIQIAENNDTWARAGRTPTVDLSGSFSNNITKDNNQASFLQGTFYNGSLGGSVAANYVVFAGGRIKISKEQLELATGQEKLNKQVDINNLVRDIYQQYYDVLLQNERLDVISYNYQLSNDKLEYEKTKKAYGASNTYNLIQFENGIISDSINLVNQKQLIDISERRLYTLLNIKGLPNYSYSDKLSVTPEAIEKASLAQILNEENYTIKSLEMIASLNKINTKLAEAAKRPTLSLNAGVGFAENAFKFFGENPNTGMDVPLLFSNRITGNVGATASWNLYDGGVRNTNIENAKLREGIDQLSIEEAKLSINNQLDILIDNYDNQRALLTLSDNQIQLSARNLEITEERFKAGQLTSLDYRNVQTQYLNAAFNKVNAIYNLIVTKSDIDHLVGRFGE